MAIEKLLSVDEAAPYIGLTPGTIYVKICRGTMPVDFIKLAGGDIKFKPSAIEKYIESRTIKNFKA